MSRNSAINLEQCERLEKHIRNDFYIDPYFTDQEVEDVSGCRWFACEVFDLMLREQTMTADMAIDGIICYLSAFKKKKNVRKLLAYATAEGDKIYKILDL